MRSAAAYVSILLLGWTCLPGQTSQAQTLFTDVTLSTLGNVTHTGSATADIRIGTGAAWFDYDRDGDLDIYMTNRVGGNHLWRNGGGGVFVDVAAAVGAADASHDGSGVAVADHDNDGDLDIYLANGDDDVLLKNQLTETGTATFIDVTATAFPGITTPQRGRLLGRLRQRCYRIPGRQRGILEDSRLQETAQVLQQCLQKLQMEPIASGSCSSRGVG